MRRYSQDLREKVMDAVAAGKQPNRQIAETFGIRVSIIEKWTRRQRETGSVAAWPHGGGTERVLAAHQDFLRAVVKAQPDITLDEVCERVAKELKLTVSPSMVSRELTVLNLPRKKESARQSAGDVAREGAAPSVWGAHDRRAGAGG